MLTDKHCNVTCCPLDVPADNVLLLMCKRINACMNNNERIPHGFRNILQEVTKSVVLTVLDRERGLKVPPRGKSARDRRSAVPLPRDKCGHIGCDNHYLVRST